MDRDGRRGAKAEGIHAPPAMVHGCDGSEANHLPHAATHSGRGTGEPDAGLGQGRRKGLLRRSRAGDGCDNSLRHRAGPEVVVAVGGGRGTAAAGLVQMQPRRCGEGIVDQPPKGLLVAVLPPDAPQAPQQPQQLIHGACNTVNS